MAWLNFSAYFLLPLPCLSHIAAMVVHFFSFQCPGNFSFPLQATTAYCLLSVALMLCCFLNHWDSYPLLPQHSNVATVTNIFLVQAHSLHECWYIDFNVCFGVSRGYFLIVIITFYLYMKSYQMDNWANCHWLSSEVLQSQATQHTIKMHLWLIKMH